MHLGGKKTRVKHHDTTEVSFKNLSTSPVPSVLREQVENQENGDPPCLLHVPCLQ